jgi:hypothetical protein
VYPCRRAQWGQFRDGTAGASRAAVRRDDIFWGRQKTSMVAFAIKTEVRNPKAKTFAFTAEKKYSTIAF